MTRTWILLPSTPVSRFHISYSNNLRTKFESSFVVYNQHSYPLKQSSQFESIPKLCIPQQWGNTDSIYTSGTMATWDCMGLEARMLPFFWTTKVPAYLIMWWSKKEFKPNMLKQKESILHTNAVSCKAWKQKSSLARNLLAVWKHQWNGHQKWTQNYTWNRW